MSEQSAFEADSPAPFPQQLDITKPEHPVSVSYDQDRRVLYVHVDGYTALRICQIPGMIIDTVVKGDGQVIYQHNIPD